MRRPVVIFALSVVFACVPWALTAAVEDDEASVPTNLPGHAQVHLEFLGRGLIPTARVVITNPDGYRLHLPRRWTYELVAQQSLTDSLQLSRLPVMSSSVSFTTTDLICLPDARVSVTLDEEAVFHEGAARDPLSIAPGRAWGHDHALDLRLARLPAGVVFIRLVFASGQSDWVRYQLPEVPSLPLARFDGQARRLDQLHYARVLATADGEITGSLASGEWPWCRILTLATTDPRAKIWPRILIDGKSTVVIADGEIARFALRGIQDENLTADAEVLAVSSDR